MDQRGVGDVLAGHRLEEVIGQGGMGIVYRATHIGLEREVALKVISPALAHDTNFRERFKRESRVAASLRHPHIVTIYDAGEDGELLYITMEYVVGRDLSEILADGRTLPPEQAVAITSQIARALAAAHQRGLVHRDVKPANILIQGDLAHPHAFLTDFGLTRHASSVGGLTGTGQWVGTLNYVAPEQLETGDVDGRADVYSLGCVLFQAIAGRIPFERENDLAKLWAHAYAEPPRLSDVAPGSPPALDDVIAAALSKDRAERFETADDLADAARNAIGGAIPAPPPFPVVPATEIDSRGAETREPVTPTTKRDLRPPESKPPSRGGPPKTPPPSEGDPPKAPPPVPPQDREPTPPHPERSERAKRPADPAARRRLIAGTAVLAAVALGAGLLLAPTESVDAEEQVSVGNLAVTEPGEDWQQDVSGGREIEGLALEGVIAFNYSPSMGSSIMRAGGVRDPGPALDPIPPDLASRFDRAPDPETVTLGDGAEAVMYEGAANDDTTVRLMMIPTTEGYEAVGCEAPAPDFAAIAAACEATMAGAQLVDAEPVPVAPDEDLADGLSSVLGELGKAQDAAASGLDADDPDKQADAAEELSAAYSNAAADLGKLDPPSSAAPAVNRLADAFEANGEALTDLAAAARDGDEGAYAKAEADSQAAAEDAAAAQRQLAGQGYEFVGGSG